MKILLRPLTRQKLDGTPYVRDPSVESQIYSTLQTDGESLLQRCNIRDYQSKDYLQEECLVYLIQDYLLRNDHRTASELFSALFGRCAKHINQNLQALDHIYKDDAFSEVITLVFERVVDISSNRSDFYQVRFWKALDAITVNVFKRCIKEQNRDKQAIRPFGIGGSDPNEIDHESPEHIELMNIADPSPSPEQQAQHQENRSMAREALNAIKNPDHRTAFILHHYYKWPIESIETNEPTVSNYFSKTPRTIRNWMTQAEEDLQRWREEVKL